MLAKKFSLSNDIASFNQKGDKSIFLKIDFFTSPFRKKHLEVSTTFIKQTRDIFVEIILDLPTFILWYLFN